MQQKLKEIADLILGFTFRGAIVPDQNGDSFVFQAKNIVGDKADVGLQNLVKISFKGFRGAHFLQKSDIVLTLRGANVGSFRAAVVRGDVKNVIVPSSVMIIRPINQKVLSEYLAAYFNSMDGQKNILKAVTGSYIQTISRQKLGEAIIPLPSIEDQLSIIKLADNLKRQQEICEEKNKIKKNIINAIFEKII
ncbi:MAG: restriction endonuclease subunit S [Candidatus Omnitrophica bacterium]|jgi:hypothetical protein|nr:restriction endonuclease subunit S [Candidatus Omnitrophota bacterium]MDD4607488.1 restriction endonuclease subunit S [Patescibacteria group bacterium]